MAWELTENTINGLKVVCPTSRNRLVPLLSTENTEAEGKRRCWNCCNRLRLSEKPSGFGRRAIRFDHEIERRLEETLYHVPFILPRIFSAGAFPCTIRRFHFEALQVAGMDLHRWFLNRWELSGK